MVSPALASRLHSDVGPRATPAGSIGPPTPPGHTTHLSVVDTEGNAVALTSTVNLYFGSGVVVSGTGILLNNQMDDFDALPGVPNAFGLQGTDANLPEPGKRPLSSMAPTFVFGMDGRLQLAVGSPGGSTIPSTVAWAIINLIDYQMPLDQALSAPRIHHQWRPDVVVVEPAGLEAETRRALEARGHILRDAPGPFGNPQGVRVDPITGWREAASDARGEGRPAVP
jgi:gamma-glutamyltranspeptidase/glutathione hydrolase